jgi:hypothetical protein
MIRRWFIRLPCLVALTLVVGVWITSYFGGIVVSRKLPDSYCGIVAGQGLVTFGKEPHAHSGFEPPNFRFDPHEFVRFGAFGSPTLGFRYTGMPNIPDSLVIVFPLWLPTVVLAMLCWYVWRKTRGKYNGRGFPVEAAKKAEG